MKMKLKVKEGMEQRGTSEAWKKNQQTREEGMIMKRSNVVVTSIVFLLLGIGAVLSNCGGGGGGGGVPPPPPAYNLTGNWKETQTYANNTCGLPATDFPLTIVNWSLSQQQGSNTVVATDLATNGKDNWTLSGATLSATLPLDPADTDGFCTSASQSFSVTFTSATFGSGTNTIFCNKTAGGSCTVTLNEKLEKQIPNPGVSLTGTWYGYLLDTNSNLHTLQVTVNANNTTTGELIGGLATGVTHTITAVSGQPQIFSLKASDGTEGGFFVDSSFTYAVSFDSAMNLIVLQKGATSLPVYSASDIVGTWSGFEVILDGNFNLVDTYTSSATVLQNLTFTVNNKYGATPGTITPFPPVGAFNVDVTLPGNIAGSGVILMSADKSFAGGVVCPNISATFADCSFSAWKKQ